MTIKNTYLFSLAAALCIFLTSGYGLFLGEQYQKKATRVLHLTDEVIHDLSQLEVLTYHYLIYHEESAEWHWKMKHRAMLNHIAKMNISAQNNKIIKEIEEKLRSFEKLFNELIATHNKSKNILQKRGTITRDYEQRLVGQLIVSMQMLAERTLHLSRMYRKKSSTIDRWVTFSIITFYLMALIMMLFFSIWLRNIIINPIKSSITALR